MGNVSLTDTLVVSHLWQSLLLAGVLALSLRWGARMAGATRYRLAAGAFFASLILPLSVFIPAQSALSYLLEKTQAPVRVMAQTPEAGPLTSLAAPPLAIPPLSAPSLATPSLATPPLATPPLAAASLPPPAGEPDTRAAPAMPASLPQLTLPAPGWLMVLLWLGVSVVLILRTVCDLLAVERLVARARPADLPPLLRSRMAGVRICVSPDAPGPMAAGLLRPCIILPETIALASPGMLGLLEHEYAHIRRRDMAVALLQRIVLALLWWSPALYWLSRRMDEEREIACDEAAVARTGDARALARSLTSEAERQASVRAPRLAVGAIGPRSHVGRRVRRLIDSVRTSASPRAYAGRLGVASLAMAGLIAALAGPRVMAQAQPPSADAPHAAPPELAAPASDNAPANGDAPRGRPGPGVLVIDLSLEGAGIGLQAADRSVEIALRAVEGVMADMPAIREEIRRALAEVAPEAQDSWRAQAEAGFAEARAAIAEARSEIAAAREEVAGGLSGDADWISRAVGQSVREALDAASLALDAALADDPPGGEADRTAGSGGAVASSRSPDPISDPASGAGAGSSPP